MFILLLFYTNLKLSGVESYTGLNRGLESFIGIMNISPVLMDINNDGKQEIFFACDDGDGDGKGKVYAYDSDWNLMWTKDVQGNIGANPCVFDPDNDGIKEIVIGSSNGVYVLSPEGSIHDIEWIGWSFYAGINPVDIDKDGDLDILATPSTNDHAYIIPIWMDYEGGKMRAVQTDVKMLPESKSLAVKIPEKFRKSKSFNYYNIATPAVGDTYKNGKENSHWEVKIGIKGNEILGLYGETRLFPGLGIFLDYEFQPILGIPINNIEFSLERISQYRTLDMNLPTLIMGFKTKSHQSFLSYLIGIKFYYILPSLCGYTGIRLTSFTHIRIGLYYFPILSSEGGGGFFPWCEIRLFWNKKGGIG